MGKMQIVYSCLRCSWMILSDRVPDRFPSHRDPLLGRRCPSSGTAVLMFYDVAGPKRLEEPEMD